MATLPDELRHRMSGLPHALATEALFWYILTRLTDAGKIVSPDVRAANYAPVVAAGTRWGRGVHWVEFQYAMHRLWSERLGSVWYLTPEGWAHMLVFVRRFDRDTGEWRDSFALPRVPPPENPSVRPALVASQPAVVAPPPQR